MTRRNDYRWCLGKRSNDFPFGFLKIPFTDKAETNFYFQRLFLTDSVRANSKVPISSSSIPCCFLRTFHSCHHPIIAPTLIFLYQLWCIAEDIWRSIHTIHLDLAATSIFRLFLGVAEHLFRSLTLLKSALYSAIYNHWRRADDLECKRMESMCSFR